jgi:hypothetical protein
MSKQTQEEFERLVGNYYEHHKGSLNLSAPKFQRNGFITKATLFGKHGTVEVLCGPSEYHAELFIKSLADGRRRNLADLMSFETVRAWLVDYSKNASLANKAGLEADIEWIFLILLDGLKSVPEFGWLLR